MKPVVSVIMGSDSDLGVMQEAILVLEAFAIDHEVHIVSAHRTPALMVQFAQEAHRRGIQVIIAGAGGAAHLPGMVAALSPLPVIGVPVPTPSLSGVDSLYSIVQMPGGIPVATVAIGQAKNAGLLAVRILSVHEPALMQRMLAYQSQMAEQVFAKQEHLEEVGYSAYLKEMV
ncbi:5-(carboxyamino)imidazole ribonucleotide mutase [Anthocerotibacter panamensis]|uniref:5-(carboxyamino)imidazole ribonucleotide mutase n=1 Tax=Anthocerotibacter panamensis TaxID=2857077 RepID=UPI001C407337|nr:5-(carboxyamino)imidazole ribonucleotide mutase [Anthocerotibacter panamensis]